jgi:glycosyltransferase involved in cell wall biosynthesis
MPAHNAGRWIGQAIESVLDQTYHDFELVVSDNASTDATTDIVRSYGDARIRIDTTPKLISAVANHNRSVVLSRGAFVKFLHADDMLSPTCLEEMVTLASEDPSIGFVFAPRDVLLESPESPIDRDWSRTYAHLHERFVSLDRVNDGRTLFRQLLAAGFDMNWIGEPSAVLASRACLVRVGLFNPRLHQIADLDLWLRIMLSHRVGYLSRSLSTYRHHSQSVTAANARLGLDWLDRLWLLEGLSAEPMLDPDERRRIVKLRNAALWRASRTQARCLLQGRFSPVTDFADYWEYRARALVGKRPVLQAVLEEPGQAGSPESPASVDPVRR